MFGFFKKHKPLSNDKTFGKMDTKVEKWVRSTCGYCGVGCGLYIGVSGGKPVATKGDPEHPVSKGTLCPKGLTEHLIVNAKNRITSPMIRKNGKLQNANWDEAFTLVSNKFKDIQNRHGKNAIACLS
ncbi:MAG: hypothetical protein RL154_249, partial [Pseudomonadota bacterium]